MPSLKVAKLETKNVSAVNLNTFEHFYESVITHHPCTVFTFVKCILWALCINGINYFVNVISWSLIHYDLQNFYENYYLYYGYNIPRIATQFIGLTMMSFSFFALHPNHQYSKNSLKIASVVSFVVNIVILGTTCMLLGYYHHNNITIESSESIKYTGYKFTFVCQIFGFNKTSNYNEYDQRCHIYFSIYFVFMYCIYPTVSLLFTIIAMFAMTKLCDKQQRKINYLNLNKGSDVELHSNTMILLSSMHDNDSNAIAIEDYDKTQLTHLNLQRNLHSMKKLLFIYYIIFVIVWMICCCILYVFSINYTVITIKLNIFFYILLFMTSIVRIILKQIARQIDCLRMNLYNYYQYDHDANYNYNYNYQKQNIQLIKNNKYYTFAQFISFEIVTEMTMNLLYYVYYYVNFIVELSNIDNNSYIFLKITMIHIVSEICHSVIRHSKIYFEQTSQLYQKLIATLTNCNICSCCKNCVEFMWKDDSNFEEWRTRHCIDMAARVCSFLMAFIVVFIFILVIGYKVFDLNNSAILYLMVSFGFDSVYFTMVFLINYCCFNFNVWRPFLLIYLSNPKIIICLFAVSSCFVVNLAYIQD